MPHKSSPSSPLWVWNLQKNQNRTHACLLEFVTPISGGRCCCSITQKLRQSQEGESITAPNCQHFYSPDSKQVFLGFDQIFLPQTDSKTLPAQKTKAVYITNAAIVSELSSLCGIRPKLSKISSEMDPAQPGTVIKTEAYLNIVFIGAINYIMVHEDKG